MRNGPAGTSGRRGAVTPEDQKMADYAMAFALLGDLASARTETEAVSRVLHVFNIICAPAGMLFLSVVDGAPGTVVAVPPSTGAGGDIGKLLNISGCWERTEGGAGFRINIADAVGTLGVLEADGVAVPANVDHYLNLGLGLVGVCALAIRNARTHEALQKTLDDLRRTMDEVKTLEGLLPICAGCKRIRDDAGAWSQVETYLMRHTDAAFTHSICPDCCERLYPGLLVD